MREEILSTEVIYDGRVVHLRVHQVALPNGEHSKREIIQHPGAVAIVPLEADLVVVMVRQYRLAADRITLEIPAGTLEPGEVIEVCAERELQEETGYKPGKLERIGGIHPAPGYTTEFIHLFIATDLVVSALDPDADEFIEVVRMPLAEVVRLIEVGEITDAKTVAAILQVARRFNI